MKQHLFLILFFSFFVCSPGDGVVPHSLIKTEQGYEQADQLNVGDAVIAYHEQQLACGYITRIKRERVLCTIMIEIDDTSFQVGASTKIYLADKDAWVSAYKVKEGDVLFSRTYGPLVVTHVHQARGLQEIISFTIEPHHHLFISEKEILIHNALAETSVLAGTLATINSAPALLTAAGPAMPYVVAAYLLGLGLYELYAHFKESTYLQHGIPSPPSSPQGPFAPPPGG